MQVECICQRCGAAFFKVPSVVQKGKAKFCSLACRWKTPELIFDADGASARVPLIGRGGEIRAYALIDIDDAPQVGRYRWCLTADGYAMRNILVNGQHDVIRMHRDLLGMGKGNGVEVDHINRDTLDNRRQNLRPITHNGNKQNRSKYEGTSKYRGVCWSKGNQRWLARIKVNGHTHHLGSFTDEHEAGRVAQAARMRLMPYAID